MSHKHQYSVVRVEGLKGLEDLLNQTEGGKVDSWQRVGEGAVFICVLSGVPVKDEEPVAAEPVEEEGRKRKSA